MSRLLLTGLLALLALAAGVQAFGEVHAAFVDPSLRSWAVACYLLLKTAVVAYQDPITGSVITAGNLRVAPNLRHLCAYLVENLFIQGMRDINEACLPVFSRDVMARIRKGDSGWEEMVPANVAKLIKERKLFGWQK